MSDAEQLAATVYVWKKMRHQFGKRWIADYGEADVKNETFTVWMETFTRLSMNQLIHGAEIMFREAPRHPPNLGIFVKYCMSHTENPPEVQKYLDAPEKRADPEGLKKIRKKQGKVQRMSTVRDAEFVLAWERLQHSTQWQHGPLSPERRAEYMGEIL